MRITRVLSVLDYFYLTVASNELSLEAEGWFTDHGFGSYAFILLS